MKLYEKNKKKFETLVEEYNKNSEYKINFNDIDKMVTEFYKADHSKDNDFYLADQCTKFYKKISRPIYEKMEEEIRDGKKTVDDVKDKANMLRGVLKEFYNIGMIDGLDNKSKEEKDNLMKLTENGVSHSNFNLYDDMYYRTLSEDDQKVFTTLTKYQEKAINYQLKNFSGTVDYKNELKKANQYTSENLINNLKADTTNRDNYKEETLQDYLVKYEALRQKHNSRNIISRFFHFAEKDALREAEANIIEIRNKDQNYETDKKDNLLSFVSKKIKGSNTLHEFGIIFLKEDKVVDYSSVVREKEDLLEVQNDPKKEAVKGLEKSLDDSFIIVNNNDLNKSFNEKDLIDEMELNKEEIVK